MNTIIIAKTANKILRRLRLNRAEEYHEAVVLLGSHSYWANKLKQRLAV